MIHKKEAAKGLLFLSRRKRDKEDLSFIYDEATNFCYSILNKILLQI